MNKTLIFFLSVLSLIVVTFGFTYYDLKPSVKHNFDNITFRKRGVILTSPSSQRAQSTAGFDKVYSVQSSSSRVKVKNNYRTAALTSEVNRGRVANYVSDDLSLMSDRGASRVTLSSGTTSGYRRYIADNSGSYAVTGVSSPQALRININQGVSQSYGSEVIATGPMMGAIMNHDHIFDPRNPDKCGQDGCDAIPTFPNGWGDGIIEGDTQIEWVPIGDVALPMFLLAMVYLLFVGVRRKF